MLVLYIFGIIPLCSAKRYRIVTYTGNHINAGTDANIFITIYGTKNDSGQIDLPAADRDIFERNEIDTFIVDIDDLGVLEKVLITNDMSSTKPGWFLDKVTISTEDGDFYEFPIYSWIDEKSSQKVEKDMYPHQYKRSNFDNNQNRENLEPLGCNDPLGMTSGRILDYQITASTSFNDLHLPYHARLNYIFPNSFGGWCPYRETEDEFLQIELNELTTITGIATQGLGLVDEWTKTYYLKYKSIDDLVFKWYKDETDKNLFRGNIDQNATSQHWLSPPIVTRNIRIYPKDYHGKACLRVEIFGCHNETGKVQTDKVGDTRGQIRSIVNRSIESVNKIMEDRFITDKPLIRPVLYINFENISTEGIIRDSSGCSNDVKVHPPVDIIPFSRSCGAGVRLDGGFLIIDGEFFIDKPTVAITILVWVKLFSNGGQHAIFNTRSRRSGPSNQQTGYILEIDRGRVKWYHITETSSTTFNISTGLQIPAHIWTHIAVTYEVKSGKSAIFVNSKLAVQTKSENTDQMLSQDWSGGVIVGKYKDLKCLNGELDEFYIFRESLTPSKIEAFMKKCLFEINCKEPLGMESREIPDEHITASSSYNLHFPFYARLNLVGVNGDPARTGWCADSKDGNPYIEVDMGELKTITGISIQGLGLFDNWVTSFIVCYTTNEMGNIFCVKDNGVDKIYEGNNDKGTIVRSYLKYPIATEKIRIKPVSWFGNHLCMRFELFGCSQDLYPDPFDNSGKINAKLVENEDLTRGNIPDNCDSPLGISSGELDDTRFAASSELDSQHQSRFARLMKDYPNEDISPNSYANIIKSLRTCWCAAVVNMRQYLEVDLGELKNVTQIATQGYFTKDNWVSTFRIGYGDDVGPIKWYSEDGVDKIFDGNTDAKHIVNNYFFKPIRARYLRVNPRSWVGSHICMRFEIYGCDNDRKLPQSFQILQPAAKEKFNQLDQNIIQNNPHGDQIDKKDVPKMVPLMINPKNLFLHPSNIDIKNTPSVNEAQYSSLNGKLDKAMTLENYESNGEILSSLKTNNEENQTTSIWDDLIHNHPDLILHGVTAPLLESISNYVPNLFNKINQYFEKSTEKNRPVMENHPYELLNSASSEYTSGTRKGLINHFGMSGNVFFNNTNQEDEWIDPNHNVWSEFTRCSQDCGIGIRMRQRQCDYPVCPSPGIETEIEPCFMHSCESYGSQYTMSMWSPFTQCTQKCGIGHSVRFRMCDDIHCVSPGYETQTIPCYMPKCPVCNYDFENVDENKIILDVSGTGNNGVIDGDAFINKHEESCGYYLDLNTSGSLIMPDQTFRNKPKVGITVALWIRIKNIYGTYSIFATEISNGPDRYLGSYHLEIVDGRIKWFLKSEKSDEIFSMETQEIVMQQGVWMHLCLTYDTITLSGILFLDGIIRHRFNGFRAEHLITEWGARAIIGDYDFDARHLNGHIDDFYMFDYAISQTQVSELINKLQNSLF